MVKRTWSYGSSTEWLRSPEPMRWRRTYSGRTDQVPAVRDFTWTLFAGTGHENVVAFIVTELASSAVRHTRSGQHGGWFGLEVVLADLAYIGVTDLGGGGVPTVIPEPKVDEFSEHGRGLRTICKLAVAIGIHGSTDGGHTVWADVDLRANVDTRQDLRVVQAS